MISKMNLEIPLWLYPQEFMLPFGAKRSGVSHLTKDYTVFYVAVCNHQKLGSVDQEVPPGFT